MAIDPPPPNPERERLEAILDCSRKRLARAEEKVEAATWERNEAIRQLIKDEDALALWIHKNPPAQPDLF